MTRSTRLVAIFLVLIVTAALAQQPASRVAPADAAPAINRADKLNSENAQLNGCGGVSFIEAGPAVAGGNTPFSIASGDFDLDGNPDLAIADAVTGPDNLTILLGNVRGRFNPAPGSPAAAGSVPRSVTVGDFNLDGRPDLAVANTGSNNVTILLGDGTGRFPLNPSLVFAVGTSPFSIVTGDFNRDGKPDLATANENSNNVSILLGNGTGRFDPPSGSRSPIKVGISPRSLVIGDFNQDGNPDLAVANSFNNNVTILLSLGDGGFIQAFGSPIATGNDPLSLTAGDFNKDGRLDLAVANRASSDLSILLGSGSGRFIESASIPLKLAAVFVVARDFDLDGNLDLAAANAATDNLSLLSGDGRGGFREAAGSPISAGDGPRAIALGDFNHDGKTDIAAANENSNDVTIQINTCTAFPCSRMSFSQPPGSPVSVEKTPRSVAVGDLNRDGRPDLAVANGDSDNVTILLSNRGFGFTPSEISPIATGSGPEAVVMGDFDLDTFADLAVANFFSDTVTILLGDGGGHFKESSSSPILVAARPDSLVVGDFNADGRPDLAVTSYSNVLTILLGGSGGSFTLAPGSPRPLAGRPKSIAVGDFNLDRKTDLAVAFLESDRLLILQGLGGGAFTFAASIPVGRGRHSVAGGDLNLDGSADLAVTNSGSSDVTVLLNDGRGSLGFSSSTTHTGGDPEAIAIGDFNHDGKPDLGVADFFHHTVIVLSRDVLGVFVPLFGSPVPVGDGPSFIAAGDFNQDSKSDLAVANSNSNNITILLNNGVSAPSEPPLGPTISVGSGPSSLAIGDFNLDGKLDLAVADENDDNVMILLGDASGRFTQSLGPPIPVGKHPGPLAVGDFNQDGNADIAVANYVSNDVSILLGNGAGGVKAPRLPPIPSGVGPFSVACADFNRDGKLDLAVANRASDTVTILFGDGLGGFKSSTIGVGSSPFSIAGGDFNRDGRPDLAVANRGSDNLTILLGNSIGGFNGSTVGAGNTPRSVAVDDFNLDGKLDLAVANDASDSVTILLGDGIGGFGPPSTLPIPGGPSPIQVAVGDFSRDGKPDLAVASSFSRYANNVTILLGNGRGAFTPSPDSPITMGNDPSSVVIGDFNLDGKPDFAVSMRYSNIVSVRINACTGRMGP